ncbi:MAG: Bax inhibitor-1/YccA family protein [Candidatus Omnitrophica bacterium]|nr:Bax inhibitor-1/YccA family protein [Candidatus Omnitrophota bacterium]
MRTSNPILNPQTFSKEHAFGAGEVMTVQGTINKCFALFFLLVLSASWVWNQLLQVSPTVSGAPAVQAMAGLSGWIFGGAIAGFILALVTAFRPQWAAFTAPLYAACEGLFLGGISAYFEASYPGLVIQAVALTFATMFCMLFIYKTGIVKVTPNFARGLMAATGAIALIYLGSWILSFFGMTVPFLYGSSPVSIGISFVIVGIAAFNLVLDFHIIEEGAAQGAAKHMEWYGAFALMVTLVWLYMEILRLLAKMRDRR